MQVINNFLLMNWKKRRKKQFREKDKTIDFFHNSTRRRIWLRSVVLFMRGRAHDC